MSRLKLFLPQNTHAFKLNWDINRPIHQLGYARRGVLTPYSTWWRHYSNLPSYQCHLPLDWTYHQWKSSRAYAICVRVYIQSVQVPRPTLRITRNIRSTISVKFDKIFQISEFNRVFFFRNILESPNLNWVNFLGYVIFLNQQQKK